MNKNKKKNIIFIVLVSIFMVLWVASLVFFAISTFSESATTAIETFFKDKIVLSSSSLWATIVNTTVLLVILLSDELKKKYLSK